jgi:hypothetical protein
MNSFERRYTETKRIDSVKFTFLLFEFKRSTKVDDRAIDQIN